MSAIPILLGLGLLIAGGFLAAFVWAVRSGQFDDTTTPSMRILADGPISDSVSDVDHDKGGADRVHRQREGRS